MNLRTTLSLVLLPLLRRVISGALLFVLICVLVETLDKRYYAL